MPKTDNPKSDARATILVVDDDVALLELCATKLRAKGMTLLTALGSTEAHRLCADLSDSIPLACRDRSNIYADFIPETEQGHTSSRKSAYPA